MTDVLQNFYQYDLSNDTETFRPSVVAKSRKEARKLMQQRLAEYPDYRVVRDLYYVCKIWVDSSLGEK